MQNKIQYLSAYDKDTKPIIIFDILSDYNVTALTYKIFCYQFNLFFCKEYLIHYGSNKVTCYNYFYLNTEIHKLILITRVLRLDKIIEKIFQFFINRVTSSDNTNDILCTDTPKQLLQYTLNIFDNSIVFTIFTLGVISETTILILDISKIVTQKFLDLHLKLNMPKVYI